MATFTMRLKDVARVTKGDYGLLTYPIFDEAYRPALNEKIFDHFHNREIGQETVEMFRLALRRKMNEIMPLYNQLYKSELLTVNPFLTFSSDSTSTNTGTADSASDSVNNATNTTKSEARNRLVGSDTPQTLLSETGEYATSAQDSSSTSSGDSEAEDRATATTRGTQQNEATSSTSGFSGSQSELLIQYRQTFLNIDMMVIEELEGLFMLIWSNSDSAFPYTTYNYPFGGF